MIRIIIFCKVTQKIQIYNSFQEKNSLLPIPYSLLPAPYSLFPIPYSLLPRWKHQSPTPFSNPPPLH